MSVLEAVDKLLLDISCDNDERAQLLSLFNAHEKVEVLYHDLDENKNYLLANIKNKPQVLYLKEGINSKGEINAKQVVLDFKSEEKKRNARERKRKSRARLNEKHGEWRRNIEYEYIRNKEKRIAEAAEKAKKKIEKEKRKQLSRKRNINPKPTEMKNLCSPIDSSKTSVLPNINALSPFILKEDCDGAYVLVQNTQITVRQTIEHFADKKEYLQLATPKNIIISKNTQGKLRSKTFSKQANSA